MVMAAGLVAGLAKKSLRGKGKRVFGRRRGRRKRQGITMSELNRIMLIKTMVGGRRGGNDPLTMMLVMKSMGGRL